MESGRTPLPFFAVVVAAAVSLGWLFAGAGAAAEKKAGEGEQEAVDVGAMLEKASDYEACDDYEGARKILTEAREAAGGDTRVVVALAVVELKMGAVKDALGHLEEARKQGGDTAEVLLWSAAAQAAAGKKKQSSELLGAGLEAAGTDEVSLYDLAEKFLRSGAMGVSAPIYRKITEVYPTDSQFDIFSYLHLAAYYGLSGREGDAAEIFTRTRHLFEYSDIDVMLPQECDYLIGYFQGLAAIRGGDVEGGVNLLKDTAAKFPDGIVADAEVVRALDAAKKTAEADGAYAITSGRLQEAVRAAPESSDARHNMAVLSAVSRRNLEEGLAACEWALRLAPLRPEYLETKAELLSQLGRNEEALVAIQRAMVLVSTPRWVEPFGYDSFVWRRLEILEKMGRGVPAAFKELPEAKTAK